MVAQLNALMARQTTLVVVAIFVGVFAYLGANVITPEAALLRRVVGYLTGVPLIFVGLYSIIFGAGPQLTLLELGVYQADVFHLEWVFVGVVASVVGALLVRQAFRRL